MGFTISQIQKTLFQAIKTRRSKSRNIEISLKELVQGFGKKLAIQARKMGFTISQIQKRPLQAITTRSPNSQKIEIFTKILSPLFWSKIGHFSFHSLFGHIGQGNVFYNIYEGKKSLSRLQKKSSKNRKIPIFLKGLGHGFGHTLAILTFFILGLIGQKMCFTIFQNKKTPLQAIKTKRFQMSKN